MTVSCFYEGAIRHRRHAPRIEFRHALALAYLDLEELPGLLGGRLVRGGVGPVRFRRADYLGGREGGPLAEEVRRRVAEQIGRRPEGPIRLLTQLRSFGICFNPVSFYYCFEESGRQLEAIVAEVTNTPWGERHAYVLAGADGGSGILRARFDKQLHVSPFMGMDHRYECAASIPGEMLSLHIESERDGTPAFDATLSMRRHTLDRNAVIRHVLRFPASSLRVLALIYGHAVQLRVAGATVFAHPRAKAGAT